MNKSAGYELVSTEEPAPPYDEVGESASEQTAGQTSELTTSQTWDPTTDRANDATGEQMPPNPPTQADLQNSFPKPEASHQDVIAWLNQLVRYRGESFELNSSTSNRDLRFLVGHDLETMTEEELRGILPADWPDQLRLLIAKDVKRYVTKRRNQRKSLVFASTMIFMVLFMVLTPLGINAWLGRPS
ncbi:hypothetical protein GQ53DRAFT_742023 [Thozetella sp. PMI_491]|nr:hypothetical protein GQ53DRAFT_742023 [Thozetella sp. PMI_491]